MAAEDTYRAYRELEEPLRKFVSRRVPSSDVEDVLQDVFLRMHGALPSLRDEQRVVPWLYAIARSAILDSHRRRAREPRLVDELPFEVEPDRESNEPTALEQELATYILAYVAQLPSPYREALTLTELEGLTQRAAAELVGISVAGMKSRVQRGREKVRELLEACCRIGLDARGRVIACQPRDSSDCRCRQ